MIRVTVNDQQEPRAAHTAQRFVFSSPNKLFKVYK